MMAYDVLLAAWVLSLRSTEIVKMKTTAGDIARYIESACCIMGHYLMVNEMMQSLRLQLQNDASEASEHLL